MILLHPLALGVKTKAARSTSVIRQHQIAKQASVLGGHPIIKSYCFCNFAAEGEAFRNCKVRVKSQDGLYSGGNASGVWRQTC